MTQRDTQSSVPTSAVSGAAVKVRERSRHSLQQKLDQSQKLLQELSEEHQHRLHHLEAAVPDTLVHNVSRPAGVVDTERGGSGNQGRVRAAADETTRGATQDMAAEGTTPEAELPPENRSYAAVGDRALTARIKETQATISFTSGQLDAMAQKDQERESPLPAPAAKMRARARRALQRQLEGAQTELREMTEEEQRRTEHPELSVPDTAAELRANTDHQRTQEPMNITVDHPGPAM